LDLTPEALAKCADELRRLDTDFALVGGLAVGAHTEPRFTKDVDFAVSLGSDREAELLIKSLFGRGFRMLAQLENKHSRRLLAVRLEVPGFDDGPILDILFAASGIECEVVSRAVERPVFPGVPVKVARPIELIAMKLLAMNSPNRRFDRADLAGLLAVVDQPDVEEVRGLLSLITERGWNRDRDLVKDLDELLLELDWPEGLKNVQFHG